ncbi:MULTISPECIES: alpha/beta hydrolase family protein [unclassified Streptomyces]|uniref:alpha/beta hydrolase family protein n=1 Tax=unclassified Streptomyces TaxID=2593676 RepID=UPI00352CEA9D
MIRVKRIVTATLAVLTLAAVSPELAQAQPSALSARPLANPLSKTADGDRLPPGWRISGTGAARQLIWTSPDPVPMGDARVEFHAGDRLLGRPVAARDRHSFHLALDGARIGSAAELKVLAGGRRLDAAGTDAGAGHTTPPPTGLAPAAPQPEAPLPANQVDPGVPGPYRTARGAYTLDSVRLPGFKAPVEMRGTVVGPTNAPGKRPLALFLHGRHYTCYTTTGEDGGEWPCKAGALPVPSEEGYLRAQQLLASQGYVTVSIAANGINGQDGNVDDGGAQARSSLVRLHLARWAQWAAKRSGAPAAVRAVAPPDPSRVLLVGHSRGGEGVNRAALDSLYAPAADQDGYHGPVRWNIRGTVLIGPTIFGQNPAPDVPSLTILPGCDGDVSDLQGEIYVDGTRGVSRGAALHSAVYMVGANHNFFNSEWTPGQAKAPATDDFGSDDTPDRVCAPGTRTRLTATGQQQAGATYIAAAARLFVAGDDRVRPLLDGSGRRAPSADPARVLSHAVGAHRTPAFLPGPGLAVSGGRVCAQVDPDPARACLPPDTEGASPHFAGWEAAREPGRDAVALRWSSAGSAVAVRPARPVSLAGGEALALRVIVPPNTTGTQLDVTLVDASGHRATLGRARVDGLPGTGRTASYWGREVRMPLSAAARAGLDLKRVAALELTPRTRSGQAWLMDAWGWKPGTPAVHAPEMPRVDIGRLTVKEGDSGTRTYRVPVRVSGQGSGQVRLFVPEPGTDKVAVRTVTVRPGRHDLDVPVTVRGNTRYGYDVSHDAFVKAVRGTVVGSHRGGVTAQNDDPMPTVTATPVADHVVEGQALTWRVSLSTAADADVMGEFALLPVGKGAELSTLDVSPQWLKDTFDASPAPARPLSKVVDGPSLVATVPAGRLSTDVTVPTVKDGLSEPVESLRARLITYDTSWEPHPGPEFTGTVRDAS